MPWLDEQLGEKQATHGVYIEIVVLAVIIALEGKRTSDSDIVLSLFGAIIAIVLAELYSYYLGTMVGSGRRPTRIELQRAAVATGSSLVAIVPPVALLMLGVLGVISLKAGFEASKWTGVAIIGAYALVAHRRAGLTTRASVPLAALLALIGLGLVLLKQYFH